MIIRANFAWRSPWSAMRTGLENPDDWQWHLKPRENEYVPYDKTRPSGGSHRAWSDVKSKAKTNAVADVALVGKYGR